MAKKSHEFFATRVDILRFLEAIEAKRSIQYVMAGLFESEIVKRFQSARDIENIGVALKGDQNQEPMYLIVDADLGVDIRKIPQRHGGIKYAIDQLQNPKSVVIKVGGKFGDNIIIAGQIGTTTDDPNSIALFKVFSEELRKQFKKVKAYYLSPEAVKALERGARLTSSLRASADTDLRM